MERPTMSPAAFAMLMEPAKQEFNAALQAADINAIESALATLKRLHGYDAFCDDVNASRFDRPMVRSVSAQ
jgi:hypothetical protein